MLCRIVDCVCVPLTPACPRSRFTPRRRDRRSYRKACPRTLRARETRRGTAYVVPSLTDRSSPASWRWLLEATGKHSCRAAPDSILRGSPLRCNPSTRTTGDYVGKNALAVYSRDTNHQQQCLEDSWLRMPLYFLEFLNGLVLLCIFTGTPISRVQLKLFPSLVLN